MYLDFHHTVKNGRFQHLKCTPNTLNTAKPSKICTLPWHCVERLFCPKFYSKQVQFRKQYFGFFFFFFARSRNAKTKIIQQKTMFRREWQLAINLIELYSPLSIYMSVKKWILLVVQCRKKKKPKNKLTPVMMDVVRKNTLVRFELNEINKWAILNCGHLGAID